MLYDHLADRWLVSQFSLPNYPYGPFYECIAVSQTSDPTGAWYRYAYRWVGADGKDIMNDYPKFGVWPDGYYMTANQYAATPAGSWRGAGVAAFERDKMLFGQAARMIYFDVYQIDPNFGNLLPADLDGPPPARWRPGLFCRSRRSLVAGHLRCACASGIPGQLVKPGAFHLWERRPAAAGDRGRAFQPTGRRQPALRPGDSTYCVPQPGSTPKLDGIGDRLMHRLQYRNFGAYQTLVANHTVGNLATSESRAALRWYELRKTNSDWQINQQGTYAGGSGDSEHRWMGSIAMDRAGDIALGYSVSSSSTYPSIRYAGRLASDPLNTLARGEASLVVGSGRTEPQPGALGRLQPDVGRSVDDCTFWYTNEYIQSNGDANWRTRIGAFSFPSCQAEPYGASQAWCLKMARLTVTGCDGNGQCLHHIDRCIGQLPFL